MRIGIIGANGYLGNAFSQSGIAQKFEFVPIEHDEVFIGMKLDWIVDAGFPRNYKDASVAQRYLNVIESRLQNNPSTRYLYIGSWSSLSHPLTKYGFLKNAAESIVQKYRGSIIRPGLVIDLSNPGGRFEEFRKIVSKIPVRLVLPTNWCRVKVTYLDILINTISYAIEQNLISTFLEVEYEELSFNELVAFTEDKKITIHVTDGFLKLFFKISRKFPFGFFDNLNSIGHKSDS